MAEIPAKLTRWAEQPGTRITRAELDFINEVHVAAEQFVGYGWMQQVIEWIWQERGIGSWGPESHQQRISDLEAQVRETQVVWATDDAPFKGPQVLDLLRENEKFRGQVQKLMEVVEVAREALNLAIRYPGETSGIAKAALAKIEELEK